MGQRGGRRRGAGRSAEKERFWRGMVRRQAASGLSVRAFCRQSGVSEPSFYAWRRTLAQRDAKRTASGGKRANPSAGSGPRTLQGGSPTGKSRRSSSSNRAATEAAEFLPLVLADGSGGSSCAADASAPGWEIISPAGWRVRFASAFGGPSEETLARLLQLVNNIDCGEER